MSLIKGVHRIDVGGSLRPPRRMPDGRVLVDAYITRVGVFQYPGKDGKIIRELRHPDDVFQRASMDSFAMVPVTNHHPKKMLTSATARDYMVGASGEKVERDGEHMKTQLMIADAETIGAMERGDQVEVSNGYYCDLEEKPGIDPVYGRYDVRQRNIVGNHIALVEEGRAGATVRARMDDAGSGVGIFVENDKTIKSDLREGDRRDSFRSMSDEALRAMNAKIKDLEAQVERLDSEQKAAVTRADAADGKLDIANKTIGDLNAQLAARMDATQAEAVTREKTRADEAEAKIRRFDEKFDKAVADRAELMNKATVIMGPKFRMDDLTARQIRVEVVKRLDSTVDVGDKVGDGKIEGLFDALVDGHLKNARQLADISEHLDNTAGQADRSKPVEKTTLSRRDAWKQPLPNAVRFRNAKEI